VPLLIDNEASATLLDMPSTLAAMEAMIREEAEGRATNRNKANIHIPRSGGPDCGYRYCSMEGGSRDQQMAGIRIKSDVLTWPVVHGKRRMIWHAGGPDTYCGLILLFDTENGELLAILNDGYIQHMRVGATYGVACKYLAPPDAQRMGLLGTGGMARTSVEAFARVRPIRQVKVFSLNAEHRREFAREMQQQLGIAVVAVDSAEAAAEDVDILATMTDSDEPTVEAEWLKPGMFVAAVHLAEMSGPSVLKIDRRFWYGSGMPPYEHFTTPDDWRPISHGGTTDAPSEFGQIAPQRTLWLADLVAGRIPAREADHEIAFFHGEGTGTQFIATAGLVYRLAKQQGLGIELKREWFLQYIRN
jgi:alanine dehydrogenase